MAHIHAYHDRGITYDFTVKDANGDAIIPDLSDLLRVVIGREGKIGHDLSGAKLVVVTDTDTENGSGFQKNTPSDGLNRLRLDADDIAMIPPGVYTLFLDYYDHADFEEWKNADRHVFVVERT